MSNLPMDRNIVFMLDRQGDVDIVIADFALKQGIKNGGKHSWSGWTQLGQAHIVKHNYPVQQ